MRMHAPQHGMRRAPRMLIVWATATSALRTPPSVTAAVHGRRTVLASAAAAAASALAPPPAALAAEEAKVTQYKNFNLFGEGSAERCENGEGAACERLADGSEYIRKLQKQSRDNKEKNARQLYEQTIRNLNYGEYFDSLDKNLVQLPNGKFAAYDTETYVRLRKEGKIKIGAFDQLIDPSAAPPPSEQQEASAAGGGGSGSAAALEYSRFVAAVKSGVDGVVFQPPRGDVAYALVGEKMVSAPQTVAAAHAATWPCSPRAAPPLHLLCLDRCVRTRRRAGRRRSSSTSPPASPSPPTARSSALAAAGSTQAPPSLSMFIKPPRANSTRGYTPHVRIRIRSDRRDALHRLDKQKGQRKAKSKRQKDKPTMIK